eukprot:227143-Amorphochlora_amoeboformis.AAC.1
MASVTIFKFFGYFGPRTSSVTWRDVKAAWVFFGCFLCVFVGFGTCGTSLEEAEELARRLLRERRDVLRCGFYGC